MAIDTLSLKKKKVMIDLWDGLQLKLTAADKNDYCKLLIFN